LFSLFVRKENKRSTVAEMCDRLATIDMGQKVGCVTLFRWVELSPHLTQCSVGWGLPPYQLVSWSIQLFGHNRHEPKIGGCGRGCPLPQL